MVKAFRGVKYKGIVMALGKAIGDIDFKMTSADHAADGSGVTLNFDGSATGFGTVLGTLVASGAAGDKHGTCSWTAQGFLDNGEQVVGKGGGTWTECGKHQWRVRMLVGISDGSVVASDSTLDLASRSLKGKLLEWD